MTEWITFLTVLAGFIYQLYRETRQRKWDKEDRDEVKRQLLLNSHVLETKVAETKEQTLAAIADNTLHTIEVKQEARAAYREANAVNLKLASIGLRIHEGRIVLLDHPKN